MLTIEVELLTGRYAATAHNDRGRAEWPPHPARFYSALVAALHDRDPVDGDERAALLWLEQQEAPALDVDLSVSEQVGRRTVHDVFVPVNDVTLIGDAEEGLRRARESLLVADASPDPVEKKRLVKEAASAIKKEEAKLKKTLSEHNHTDEQPSKTALETAAALLPHQRTRQVRTFPVVLPARATFAFVWPNAVPPTAVGAGLSRLCARVTRLGHSTSLVRCGVTDRAAAVNLAPNEDGDEVLRTVGPGQLSRLEREFERHQAVESRILPARPRRYGPPQVEQEQARPETVFSRDWIVLERIDGARPMSSLASRLCRVLRAALLEQSGPGGLPASLSGHLPDGSPAATPHLAFVALPFVGHEHADGSIKGCAVIPPRSLDPTERETFLRLFARWERERAVDDAGTLELAGHGLPPMRLRRVDVPLLDALRATRWSRAARRFVTATPIALDRNPGNLRSGDAKVSARAALEAQRSVATACERIGLPRPEAVEISASPLLQGAQPTRAFTRQSPPGGKPARVMVHAEIRFDTEVLGPVLLGAGRHFGLGLCLPLPERSPT
jgi:CRISPR-associated protein Csb2